MCIYLIFRLFCSGRSYVFCLGFVFQRLYAVSKAVVDRWVVSRIYEMFGLRMLLRGGFFVVDGEVLEPLWVACDVCEGFVSSFVG